MGEEKWKNLKEQIIRLSEKGLKNAKDLGGVISKEVTDRAGATSIALKEIKDLSHEKGAAILKYLSSDALESDMDGYAERVGCTIEKGYIFNDPSRSVRLVQKARFLFKHSQGTVLGVVGKKAAIPAALLAPELALGILFLNLGAKVLEMALIAFTQNRVTKEKSKAQE